jgi:hypothetical protein
VVTLTMRFAGRVILQNLSIEIFCNLPTGPVVTPRPAALSFGFSTLVKPGMGDINGLG